MPTLSWVPVLVQPGDPSHPSHSSPEPDASTVDDLRMAFAGLARILAGRAERNLPLDTRSVRNLLRVYRQLMVEEMA
jgi:hypothetical protein